MRIIKPRKLYNQSNREILISEENTYKYSSQNNNPQNKKHNQETNISVIIIITILVSLISSSLCATLIMTLTNNNIYKDNGITKSVATLKETNSISAAVDNVYDSVVVVEVYNKENTLVSTGTGFVYKKVNDKAYIMTNNHVISNGETIKVLFTNQDEITANIVGSDTYSDIAILSIKDTDKIVTATLGKSTDLKVGDTVFTVGSPEGSEYAGTVTKGILSAKERLVAVALENTNTEDYYMEVLQTDAAINPGNSGGPLCNINGAVIGITNMKLVSDTVEGMGFAIPIEEALNVAEVLEKDGKINRPKLGVSISTLDNKFELYYQSGILIPNDINEGIVIVSIEDNSVAANANLKKGDIIIKINNKNTDSLAKFRYELYKCTPGDKITLTYIRDSKEETTTLTLSN